MPALGVFGIFDLENFIFTSEVKLSRILVSVGMVVQMSGISIIAELFAVFDPNRCCRNHTLS